MKKDLHVLTKFLTGFFLYIFCIIPSYIAAATCAINGAGTQQVIRGFGGSSAWSDWGGNSADNAWLVAHASEFFTTTSGIGLTMIRARINPETGQWGGTAAPLQAARDLGVTDIYATAWTPPATWKSNGAVDNASGGYLLTQYYDEYANYLRDYVIYMRDNQNLNMFAISPANEPDYMVSYDGCTWSGDQLRNFVRDNLGPTLQAAGLTTKILIGESFNNNNAYILPTVNDATARNYLFAGATHFYGSGPFACPELATYGKEYWQTEKSSFETYDASMTHGLTTARWVHNGLVTAEYNVFTYWWLSTDNNNEGLTSETLGTPKRYYTFGNFSKYIRPGYYRIDATANPSTNVYVSAYRDPASTAYVIVAINSNTSGTSQQFDLSGIGVTSFTPYITSSSQNLAQLANVAVSGASFTYTLPAQSVISFVGSMPAGSPTRTRTPTPYAGTPTFTPTPSNTVSSVLLDDMEDGNITNNWSGNWYSYSGTGTTITPKPFVMTAGGMTGSTAYRAQIVATVADYAGMGTNLAAGDGSTAVDLSSYIGIEFYAKGNGGTYFVQFPQPSITGGDNYGATFTAPATWTKVTILFASGLATRWGETAAFTQNAITAIQWANYSNGALDIQIDDVRMLTNNPPTATYTRTRTPGTTATFTATRTITRTATRTSTATYSGTATPVNTLTSSVVPTATFTRTSTSSVSHTPTATRTVTPVNSGTYTGTHTPSVTQQSTFTNTRTPANTPTLTNTAANTSTNTRTATPTDTNTTVVYTATSTATRTSTVIVSPTFTGSASATASVSPVNTNTRTPTASVSPQNTFTITTTRTNTASPQGTLTNSPTWTYSPTLTLTVTITGSRTRTVTASFSPSITITSNLSPSFTATRTVTTAGTPSFTATDTAVFSATPTGTQPAGTPTITFTPDPCACPSYFGKNVNSANPAGIYNYVEANKYVLAEDALVRALHVYVTLTAGAGRVRMAIYSDNGAAPNSVPLNMLVESSDVTVVQGWNVLDIADTSLTAGTYWIAVQAENGVALEYDEGTMGNEAWAPLAYGAFPAVYPVGSWWNYEYSMYADYCPVVCGTPTYTRTTSPTATETNTASPVVSPTITPTLILSCECPDKLGMQYVPPGATGAANFIVANWYPMFEDGTAMSMEIYSTTGGGNAILAIYSEAGAAFNHTVPGTLISQSAPFALNTGWNTVPIPQVNLQANTMYWLAYITDTAAQISAEVGSAGDMQYVSYPFNTLPSNFGAASPFNYNWAMHVNYCPAVCPPTPTPTGTETPVLSPTGTPAGTLTNTPVVSATETPADTASPSATNTPVPTLTDTPQPTATDTPPPTETDTPVPTSTFTLTATPTVTRTRTQTSTPTLTRTVIPFTPTYTVTPTSTPVIEDTMEILDALPYPNPYSGGTGDLIISFDITRPANLITVSIYSCGYRKVIEKEIPGSFLRGTIVTVERDRFERLAGGVYYMVIKGENGAEKAKSKPGKLVIIR